jgi:hypothetical protein
MKIDNLRSNITELIDTHMQMCNSIHNERGLEDYQQWKSVVMYKELDDYRIFKVDDKGFIQVEDTKEISPAIIISNGGS